jgi:uncharacterized protein (DUF169 family)
MRMHGNLKNYQGFMAALGFCDPPLVSYYTDELPAEYQSPRGGLWIEMDSLKDVVGQIGKLPELNNKRKEFKCMFQFIRDTRTTGTPTVFDRQNFGCPGARFYLGFVQKLPRFNHYFISTGFPGIYRGERLAPSADSAEIHAKLLEGSKAKAKYLVFQRIDKLPPTVTPDLVIFFANPEIISALAALVRYVTDDMDAVTSPFTSGCGSIFCLPYRYSEQGTNKAALGIFDPAARSYLPIGEMTLSLPFKLFVRLLDTYRESFLNPTPPTGYLIKNVIPGWRETKIRAGRLRELTNDKNSA